MSRKIDFFSKISRAMGFTITEVKVILFLCCLFFIGLIALHLKTNLSNFEKTDYQSSKEDSLFAIVRGDESKLVEKNVDSDPELLDFRTNEIRSGTKFVPDLAERSIDLNSATITELVLLPGIGEKTAQRIIEYRKITGQFVSPEDIMRVKGIGEKKFEKIKKYIFVEK